MKSPALRFDYDVSLNCVYDGDKIVSVADVLNEFDRRLRGIERWLDRRKNNILMR